ncbi:MAG: CPBP family intramembrane glutamate endopeptidase [Acidobacteriaceae bacterium]
MQTTSTSAAPPLPPPGPARPLPGPRLLEFALFVAAILWYLCAQALSASAAGVLDMRFDLGDARPLVEASLLLFLLVCGLALLRAIERRRAPLRQTLGLPRRATSREEWATGAAIGWGLAVAVVLPMALARTLNVQLWTAPRAFTLLALGLLTLAIATLAHALALYGYGFQRLIEATGPVRATMILMLLTAVRAAFTPTAYGTPDGTRIMVAMLAALLLSLCWLRTHGLWLLWGLNFAWAASIAVLFGLPLGGDNSLSSIVDTRAYGPAWLTGGEYGPAAAAFLILLLLAAIPILVRATSDYAWSYTHPPLIPGGYDVTLAPPAAHVAMEQAAESAQPVNPASLVQILPSTPQNPIVRTSPE